jgi:uncharacterized Tic20 family protein
MPYGLPGDDAGKHRPTKNEEPPVNQPTADHARTGQPPTTPRPGGPYGVPGSWRVSDRDRDAVAERLSAAYAEGRLTRGEFDERLGRALTATTRADLGTCLDGLYPPAPWSGRRQLPLPPRPVAPVLPPAPTAPAWTAVPRRGSDRPWAALAHALGLVTSFVGPLVVLIGPGSRSAYVREQAVEAVNVQVSFILLNLALVAATVVTLGLAALLWIPLVLAWPVVVLVAALAAGIGQPVRLPFVVRLVR